MSTNLHIYNDGSKLIVMTAKSLILIPIWKGNRIIDNGHVGRIASSIGDNVKALDSGYRLIRYSEEDAGGAQIEQTYIIDGQHRVAVLRDFFSLSLCEEDFIVTVTEVGVNSESDAIEYFNKINNVKPIIYKEDPRLIINRYIQAIDKKFNKKKLNLIRAISARRPYLSVDKLRDGLTIWIDQIQKVKPAEFAEKVWEKNKEIICSLELMIAIGCKDSKLAEKCIALDFGLAFHMQLTWISELCLN